MKQSEFVKVTQNNSSLSEEESYSVWCALCERMADSIADGHGFAIPKVGRIYIRTNRVADAEINFINYSPNKELLARLNKI